MDDAKPVDFLIVTGLKCDKDGEVSTFDDVERSQYCTIVVSLLYVAIKNRPDLRVATNVLSSHGKKRGKIGLLYKEYY